MEKPEENKPKKNRFLQIFADQWDSFKQKYPKFDTRHYNKQVGAVLKCADPQFGFRQYMCLQCGKDSKTVAYSCKSKFCLRCGRVDGENFTHQIAGKLHGDVEYRHLVLTMPMQFRQIFFANKDNGDLYGRFFRSGWECVQKFICSHFGEEMECGCLIVLHTVGRKCDYKPHLHIMLMAGGISREKKNWRKLRKFSYKPLNKIWKQTLLSMLREWDIDGRYESVFSLAEKKYKGFVTNLDANPAPKDSRHLLRYLSKYLCRPQMSLRRLLNYDKNSGEVVYKYSSHESGRAELEKVTALSFVGRMVQQILPKGFRRIRYYGLQDSKNFSRLRAKVFEAIGKLNFDPAVDCEKAETSKLKYNELVKEFWGKDPLICSFCGERMELVRIWEEGKGFVYDLFERTFIDDIGPPGNLPGFLFTATS